MNSDNKIIAASILCLSIIVLVPVWAFKYPPLQEYINHLLVVFSVENIHTEIYGFSDHFTLDYFPYPNVLAYVVIRLLALFLPILVAGKLFLSLYLIGLPLSVLFFLRSIEKDRSILVLVVFLMARTWAYHSGYVNFLAGLPCYFIALGLHERVGKKVKLGSYLAMAAMLLCLYLSSLILFAVAFLSFILISILSNERRNKLLHLAISSIPPLVMLVFFAHRFLSDHDIGNPHFSGIFPNLKGLIVYSYFSFSKLELAVMAIPMALLGLGILISIWRRAQQDVNISGARWRHIVQFLLIAVLYFILPASIGGWWPVNLMLVSLVLILPLSFIAYPRSNWSRCLFAVIILSFAALQTIVLYREYNPIDARFREFDSAWEQIPPGSIVLPVVEDGHGTSENTEPYLYFWVPYHLQRGGVGPYFFAFPRLETRKSPLEYRDFFSMPNPGLFGNDRARFEKSIAANVYDYILVFGSTKHMDLVKSTYAQQSEFGEMKVFKRIEDEAGK